jgi:DNA-binding transcriptional LysR family regulator
MIAKMQRSVLFDLNWDDVRLFLALARSRTVGSAARALGVDASTVSRRLVALEEALSTTLFDRGRDGITATKAAEELLPLAEQVEDTMARFAGAADELEREVTGLVRIASPPDLAETIIVPLLGELFGRYPALRVALDPGEALVDLTRREADLAVRVVRPARGDLVMTRLRTVNWVVVASPKLARRLGTLRSFHDAPWIGWGEAFSPIPPARWFERHVRGMEPVVRTNSLMAQIASVVAGVGVALVPEGNVARKGVVPVKLGTSLREAASELPSEDLYLVTHRALRNVPRVRAVWDLFVERLADRHQGAKDE